MDLDRRQFILVSNAAAAQALLSKVAAALEALVPAPLQDLGHVSTLSPEYAFQLLDDISAHVNTVTEGIQMAAAALATQPFVVSVSVNAGASVIGAGASAGFGVVASFDRQTGELAYGLFWSTGRSVAGAASAGVGVGGSFGTGSLSSFYGSSTVSSATIGPLGGSVSFNSGYESVAAEAVFPPGAAIGVGESQTGGESTIQRMNLYQGIQVLENTLWNASQDPLMIGTPR
ncbi:MAG TPA: hypothetical protein VHG32_13405 [Thermoanaerobaculia bacterium]|nr:hypothetical protein [Thermoanaerobaculia bacterium]